MKYRYYIIDLNKCDIIGTNSIPIVDNFIECDDCFVIDAQEGFWFHEDRDVEIKDAENRE